MDTSNLRQHQRVKNPRVLLKIPTIDRLRTHYLKDLSEGGAFIRLGAPMPMGSSLTLELHAPGLNEPLALRAKVVRVVQPGTTSEAPGMAVKFDEPDPAKTFRLKQLVEEHLGDAAFRPRQPEPKVSPNASENQQRASPQGDKELQEALAKLQKLEAEKSTREGLEKRNADFQAQLDKRELESSDLRTELFEAQGRIAALEEQLLAVEQDEATSRVLGEKVAEEKARVEKQLSEEINRLHLELNRAASRVDEARLELKQAVARAEERERSLQGELERVEEKLAAALADDHAKQELEEKLQSQHRQLATLEKRQADLQADHERLRRREGALRHLVTIMTAAHLTKDVPVLPDDPAAAQEQSFSEKVIEEEVVAVTPTVASAPPHPAEPEPSPRPAAPTVASGDPPKSEALPLPAPDEASFGGMSSEIDILFEDDAPAPKAGPSLSSPAASEDVAEFDVEFDHEAAPSPPIIPFEEFQDSLAEGARIRASPTLQMDSLTDPGEQMVASMLEQEQRLEELLDRASAHPIREQFVKLLYGLCQRKLIQLVTSGPA